MPEPPPQKSRGGLKRIWNATLYSRDGLLAAWRHEAAFRQELLLAAILLPLGLWLGATAPSGRCSSAASSCCSSSNC